MASTINYRSHGTEIWRKIRNLQKGFDKNSINKSISIKEREELEEKEIKKLLQENHCRSAITRTPVNNGDDTGNNKWNRSITTREVKCAIENSNNKESAPGEDGIDYNALKNLTPDYVEIMRELYEENMETSNYPREMERCGSDFLG